MKLWPDKLEDKSDSTLWAAAFVQSSHQSQEHLRHIVEKNIQCRDGLKFGYNFEPRGPARRNTEEKARSKQKRLKAKLEKQARLEEEKKKKAAQQKKLFGEILI